LHCRGDVPRQESELNAIKELRKYLEKDSSSDSARTLAGLAAALAEERDFPLAELYQLNYNEFRLAIDLMKDWRLDRYYASRLQLLDFVLNDILPRQRS